MFPPFFKNYSKGKEGNIDFKKKAMKRAVFIMGLKSRGFNGNLFNNYKKIFDFYSTIIIILNWFLVVKLIVNIFLIKLYKYCSLLSDRDSKII